MSKDNRKQSVKHASVVRAEPATAEVPAPQAASDVEIVINNAGTLTGAQLMADDVVEKSKLEMDANFYGPMRMGVAFAPILKANGGGAIANVLSVAGLVNFPFAPTYSTSKAAGHSLTQGQRTVLAGQNTGVRHLSRPN